MKTLRTIFVVLLTILNLQARTEPGSITSYKSKSDINAAAFGEGINSFTLVDADTDTDLYLLKDGMTIDLNSIKGRNLNIRANHLISDIKVDFTLDGPIMRTWTEHFAPFALFGDSNGDYFGRMLPAGTYSLKASALALLFGGGFTHLNTIEIEFSVAPNQITAFNFRSETFMTPFLQIENGSTYFPVEGLFAGNTSVVAITSLPAGSVVLEINGPIHHNRTENLLPYSLFGDINGDHNAREFPDGLYTLTATPYTEADGKGQAGIPLTVSFTIVLPDAWHTSIIRLVNATNEIDDLFDDYYGNLIDIAKTPTNNASILVNYECDYDFGACPGSVLLLLNGPVTTSRIENVDPYTLFGDINGVLNYKNLPIGNYTIAVTPYWDENALGDPAGPTVTRDFQIVDSSTVLKTVLYPNPANNTAFIVHNDNSLTTRTIIFDLTGSKIKELTGKGTSEQAIDVSNLLPGIYMVQIQTEKGSTIKKLVIE